MIYVITTGSYSDYRINDILEHENKELNIGKLFVEFVNETHIPDQYSPEHKKRQQIMRKLMVTMGKPIEENEYFLIDEVFVNWLIWKHEFKRADYKETNLDD